MYVAEFMLSISTVQVALPTGKTLESSVASVAICAGSGGSMLAGANADVYWTGEMSHVCHCGLLLKLFSTPFVSA